MSGILEYSNITKIFYMLFAFCCPCCWGIFRLIKGWTTSKGNTNGLFDTLSKCEGLNVMINAVNMGDGKIKTTEPCIEALGFNI